MINRAKLQHILEYARQQRHIGLHCKVPPEDMVEILEMAMLQGADGNSPVIPDWQAKAEKMAEIHGSSFVIFRNGESPQCADPTKVIISFTDEGLGHGSAAPQREVK